MRWMLLLVWAACDGGKDPDPKDDTEPPADDTDSIVETDPGDDTDPGGETDLSDDTDLPDDTDPTDDTDPSDDTDLQPDTGVEDTFQPVDSAAPVDTFDTLLLDTDLEADTGMLLDLFGDGQVKVVGNLYRGTETWHYRRRFTGEDICVFQYRVRDLPHHPNPPPGAAAINAVCVGCEFSFTAVLDERTELSPPGWCASLVPALPEYAEFFNTAILGYGHGSNEFYSYYFQPQIWAPYPGISSTYDAASGEWYYLSPVDLPGWYIPPP